jgi:hypothetical protein
MPLPAFTPDRGSDYATMASALGSRAIASTWSTDFTG